MNTFKTILSLFACSLAFACGAPDEGADDGQDADFASVELPMTADGTPTKSYGSRLATDRASCDRTSSGQSCSLPSLKTFRWCANVLGGTSFDHAILNNEFSQIVGNVSTGFTWTHASTDGATCQAAYDAGTINVLVRSQTAARETLVGGLCAGTSGANIEPYSCVVFKDAGTVTESLPGAYRKHSGGSIELDRNDISTKAGGASATIASITRHGLWHSKLMLEGLGSQTSDNNTVSRRVVLPANSFMNVTTSEVCRGTHYELASGTSSFALDAVNGCPD